MALEEEQGVDLQRKGPVLSPKLLRFLEARQDALGLLRSTQLQNPKRGIPEFLLAIEAAKRVIQQY